MAMCSICWIESSDSPRPAILPRDRIIVDAIIGGHPKQLPNCAIGALKRFRKAWWAIIVFATVSESRYYQQLITDCNKINNASRVSKPKTTNRRLFEGVLRVGVRSAYLWRLTQIPGFESDGFRSSSAWAWICPSFPLQRLIFVPKMASAPDAVWSQGQIQKSRRPAVSPRHSGHSQQSILLGPVLPLSTCTLWSSQGPQKCGT